MRNEWLGDNRKGLAIVRVSSLRQEGNTSHDTQEIEIRDYCEEHGIKLIDVVKITESAKDSEFRKKYTQALNRAFVDDVRHVLFYMFDREARNLIDIERNEKLVMAGVMVLHYVRDRKVIHKDSSDSDFFIRDVQAVTNKHFIRNLRAKVSDAMKKKAESGWYPSNCVPLGYIVEKLKDENGREMKRGSIVVPDPNEKNVQWVKREFELRAQGLSYEQIRLKCIEEGLVDPRLLKYYRKAAIEKRIHNCFYNGEFFWQGKVYPGKHKRIISPQLFADAQQERRGLRLVAYGSKHGVFGGGWLKCGECGCNIIYDPKKKVTPQTGIVTIHHYYHCTNGRRTHVSQKGMNVREAVLWGQFDKAVDAISISPTLASEVAKALNEGHRKSVSAATALIKRHKETLDVITSREDRAYDDMTEGLLDRAGYKRQMDRLREERNRVALALQQAQSQIHSGFRETVQSILELAKSAKSLYKTRSPWERRDFLEKILSNPILEGLSVRYDLKKPFRTLALINENAEWRTHLDDFRTECASLEREVSHDSP